MRTTYSALVRYRHATQRLAIMPVAQQVLNLKFALFRALRSGEELHRRLEAMADGRASQQTPAGLPQARACAATEFDAEHPEHERESAKLRRAVFAAWSERTALDELCGVLVAAIEAPAGSDAARPSLDVAQLSLEET